MWVCGLLCCTAHSTHTQCLSIPAHGTYFIIVALNVRYLFYYKRVIHFSMKIFAYSLHINMLKLESFYFRYTKYKHWKWNLLIRSNFFNANLLLPNWILLFLFDKMIFSYSGAKKIVYRVISLGFYGNKSYIFSFIYFYFLRGIQNNFNKFNS